MAKRNTGLTERGREWLDSRRPSLTVGEFTINSGDLITVDLPSGSNKVRRQVEFVAHVVLEGTAPYVEVREKEPGAKDSGLTRCIRVEDIKKVGRQKVGA